MLRRLGREVGWFTLKSEMRAGWKLVYLQSSTRFQLSRIIFLSSSYYNQAVTSNYVCLLPFGTTLKRGKQASIANYFGASTNVEGL